MKHELNRNICFACVQKETTHHTYHTSLLKTTQITLQPHIPTDITSKL